MKEFSLESLLEVATAFEFNDSEKQQVEIVYKEAMHRYVMNARHPRGLNCPESQAWNFEKYRSSFIEGRAAIARIIDSYHKGEQNGTR